MPQHTPAKIKAQMITDMRDLDGIEVPKDLWALAEEIVAEGRGELSEARGPGGCWKRLTPRSR